MINANELRIGNWAKGGDILFRVKSINSPIVSHTEYGDESIFYLSKIEPIPLTEEILLKCGAVRAEYGLSLMYDELHGNAFSLVRGFIQWTHFDTPMANFPHIIYLHQFQNLYLSITGKELEINI